MRFTETQLLTVGQLKMSDIRINKSVSGRVIDIFIHYSISSSMCFLKDVTLPDYKTNYTM